MTANEIAVLRTGLLRVGSSGATQTDLASLVHFSRAVIEAHFRTSRTSVFQLTLNQGLTIKDLAFDCIADAFARDGGSRFIRIESFVASLEDPLETIDAFSLFRAYKSFLTRIAEAQLARLYAQADPQGARIHRNLKLAARSSSLFVLESDHKGLVLYPATGTVLENRPPFPNDEMQRRFASRFLKCRTAGDFLRVVHSVLTSQRDFRRIISLLDLVRLVKGVVSSEHESWQEEPIVLDEQISEFDKTAISHLVEHAIQEKLLVGYVAKGKLDRKSAEAILLAFRDITGDWLNGEAGDKGLYQYLRVHMDLDKAMYEAEFRTRMEYLLKIARQAIEAALMGEI